MSKLTLRNVARVLAWCLGLWLVTMFGMVLAGFICGVITSKPQPPITVVKYVTRAASPATSAQTAQNAE